MNDRKTTISRLLLNRNDAEKALVLKWADLVAKYGGSFDIIQRYENNDWVSIITINWPENLKPVAWVDAFGEPSKTRDEQFRWPLYQAEGTGQ